MKKQLIAAAVATAIAAPMAASADVTVYGKLHYSIDSIDYDSSMSGTIPDTGMDSEVAGYDGSAVNSHDSFFGIKGSEDLGNGLSAVFQMEFSISGDDLNGDTAMANDHNTYGTTFPPVTNSYLPKLTYLLKVYRILSSYSEILRQHFEYILDFCG